MALLSTFAASRASVVASLPPRISVYQIPTGWIVYFPPKVAAEYSGDGVFSSGIFAIVKNDALLSGDGILSSTITAIGTALADFTGSGDSTATLSLTNASVDALFSGDGLADGAAVFQYGRNADFTGLGDLSTVSVLPVIPVLADFNGAGNLNPEGLVEIEFTPLNLDGSGLADATLFVIHQGIEALFTGDGLLEATSSGAVNFQPSGMNKSGTQSFTTAWAPLNGWTADTANYPGSTVVTNGLDVQGGKANATISVSLPYISSFSYNRRARIVRNGSEILATSAAFTATGGTITVSATNVNLVDTDLITVEVIMESFASGSISAGGYVRIT